MERRDETARAAEEAAAERIEHKHPARPEQTDEGFATGVERKPDTPEEELEPNFARGVSHEDAPGTERHGDFSEGVERSPTSE